MKRHAEQPPLDQLPKQHPKNVAFAQRKKSNLFSFQLGKMLPSKAGREVYVMAISSNVLKQ